MQRLFAVVLAGVAVALTGSGVASAHDRETNNGVTVTVHVSPDDEPIAGQASTIVVEEVETRSKFNWATCKCTWKISDSSGAVLFKGPARVRTPFVFQASGAYQLTLAGRVRVTKTRWRWFKINYALRADPPAS
jgi:hypothetical protein